MAVMPRSSAPTPQAHGEQAEHGADHDREEHSPREAADGGAEGERPGGYGDERGAQEHEAVASLSRLSPSSIVVTRGEIPRRFAMPVATASVGLRIAPSATPSAKPTPGARGEEPAEKKRRDDDEDDGEPRDRREVAPELDRGSRTAARTGAAGAPRRG
jgi:hypothetical protein